MNIEYVKIKNFRNLKDGKLSFNKGLNVIVGVNSSGKTNFFSLLRFIDVLLLEGDIDKAFRKINKNFLSILKKKDNAELEIKININALGVLKIDKKRYGIINNQSFILRVVFKELDGEIKVTDFSGTIWYKYIFTEKNPSKIKPKFKGSINKLEVLNSNFYYDNLKLVLNIFHEKNIDEAKEKFDRNQIKSLDNNLTTDNTINLNFKQGYKESIGAFVRNRNFHFININPTEVRKPVSTGDFSNIPYILSENGNNLPFYLEKIFSDFKRKDEFNTIVKIDLPFISEVGTRYDDQTGYNFIIIKEGKNEIKSSWISDGTIDYIAYLSLIVGYSSKENGDIFCIEEIERNLHFALLNKLISRFKSELIENSGVQMFITTHSMNLLNNLEPSEVFLLKKSKCETELINLSKYPKINEKIEIEGGLGKLFLENELNYNDY